MLRFDAMWRVTHQLMISGAHRAVKYISPTEVLRATRRLYKGRLPRKGSNLSIEFTHGRPNYRERHFIAKCRKAGECFPVRKIQLQYPPKRKK